MGDVYAPGEPHLLFPVISDDDPSINREVMDGRGEGR
jgi:hypothetical protein